MPNSYIKIYSGSPVSVLALKDALNEINITPVIKDQAESARLGGFGVTNDIQEVYVHSDEFEAASNVIETIF